MTILTSKQVLRVTVNNEKVIYDESTLKFKMNLSTRKIQSNFYNISIGEFDPGSE